MKLLSILHKLGATLITSTLFTGGASAAIIIGPSNISASANVPSNSPQFPISAIADGITNDGNPSGLNGFVSASLGVITITFDQDYDLNSFLLWNDVNLVGSASEGIDSFSLSFFNSGGASIPSSAAIAYTAPLEQLQAGEYMFAESITDVRSVELTVLSSQWNGSTSIEIREVAFTAVPEPSSAFLIGVGSMILVGCRRRTK